MKWDFSTGDWNFPRCFTERGGEFAPKAGFDAVLGNPPYVRQEQIREFTELFSNRYGVYASAADLYTYFVERGYDLLGREKSLGYIISNKFTRAEYGKPLRRFLSEKTQLRTLCDFHDLPVFGRSVSAYPMVMVFDKGEPKTDDTVSVTNVEDLEFSSLRDVIKQRQAEINQEQFGTFSWSLSNPESLNIFNEVIGEGIDLEQYLEEDILRGILTGLNEAFIIDAEIREQILSRDPGSERFIFRLMKGDDAKRYLAGFSDRYLIRIPSGWTMSESGLTSETKAWEWFSSEYPGVAEHLRDFREDAQSRYDRGECWWELRPCDYYNVFERDKIVYPEISDGPRFSLDFDGTYTNNKCFVIPEPDYNLVGILNSTLGEFWARNKLSTVRGGYLEYRTVHLSEFPVVTASRSDLSNAVENIIDLISERRTLNLKLLDYLRPYSEGPSLSNVSLYQPPSEVGESELTRTKDDLTNLRVGRVKCKRDGPKSITVLASARYKPEDDDAHETDQWGYTETEPMPAMRLTDLTETEADLIEAFVPVAVKEAGGFANFRETATKTNSLIDRLEALTLPEPDDIEEGLERYLEAVERAEELDENIERTDELIDEIVYELYGLTEEEIEIVEEAVEAD